MGGQGLTYKQQRFAELVAAGCTKIGAFREAFPSSKRGRGTESEGAKRIARLPKVVSEIQRLSLLRSPHDAAAQSEHIVARLLELSKDANPEIALRAIAQWGKLAEAGLLKPPPNEARASQPVDRAQLVNELKGLYDKAFGRRRPNGTELLGPAPPEREEDSDEIIDVELNDTSISEPASPSSLSQLRSSLPDQDTADNTEDPYEMSELAPANDVTGIEISRDTAPGSSKPECKVELVPIPGRFPPRFRRVRQHD